MEKKSGKGLIILVAVIAVIIALVGGYSLGKGVFTKNVDSNKPNEQEKKEDSVLDNNVNENKVVDSATLERLKEIALLRDEDCTSYDSFDHILETGVVNNFSVDQKRDIVYVYAGSQNMFTQVSYEEYSYCDAGPAYCDAIKIENYNKVLKLYGMDKFEDLEVYKGMYLTGRGGNVCLYSLKYNITAKYIGEDIVLTAVADWKSLDSDYPNRAETREYTFKLNNDGDYYLYSVYKK